MENNEYRYILQCRVHEYDAGNSNDVERYRSKCFISTNTDHKRICFME